MTTVYVVSGFWGSLLLAQEYEDPDEVRAALELGDVEAQEIEDRIAAGERRYRESVLDDGTDSFTDPRDEKEAQAEADAEEAFRLTQSQ